MQRPSFYCQISDASSPRYGMALDRNITTTSFKFDKNVVSMHIMEPLVSKKLTFGTLAPPVLHGMLATLIATVSF
jgi:hypothetical protein